MFNKIKEAEKPFLDILVCYVISFESSDLHLHRTNRKANVICKFTNNASDKYAYSKLKCVCVYVCMYMYILFHTN